MRQKPTDGHSLRSTRQGKVQSVSVLGSLPEELCAVWAGVKAAQVPSLHYANP